MSTKCCWTVGVPFEEWKQEQEKERLQKYHFMRKSSLKDGWYRKTVCGLDTRDPLGKRDALNLTRTLANATCEECRNLHGVSKSDVLCD